LYRHIDDALPLYIPEWNGQLKANLDVNGQINAGIDTKFSSKIGGLLYDLDASNRNIMFEFRGAYLTYKSEPCFGYTQFQSEMKKINEDHRNLKILEIKVQGLKEIIELYPDQENDFIDAYMDIINSFGDYLPKESVKAKIYKSRKNSQKWKSNKEESKNEN